MSIKYLFYYLLGSCSVQLVHTTVSLPWTSLVWTPPHPWRPLSASPAPVGRSQQRKWGHSGWCGLECLSLPARRDSNPDSSSPEPGPGTNLSNLFNSTDILTAARMVPSSTPDSKIFSVENERKSRLAYQAIWRPVWCRWAPFRTTCRGGSPSSWSPSAPSPHPPSSSLTSPSPAVHWWPATGEKMEKLLTMLTMLTISYSLCL